MSFSELGLIIVIALIVLGPKQLPQVAQQVALWIRRWRVFTHKMQAGLKDLEKQQRLAENEARAQAAEALYQKTATSTHNEPGHRE